jgi:hypothetical protein
LKSRRSASSGIPRHGKGLRQCHDSSPQPRRTAGEENKHAEKWQTPPGFKKLNCLFLSSVEALDAASFIQSDGEILAVRYEQVRFCNYSSAGSACPLFANHSTTADDVPRTAYWPRPSAPCPSHPLLAGLSVPLSPILALAAIAQSRRRYPVRRLGVPLS